MIFYSSEFCGMSGYLGKRLHNTIKASLNQAKINRLHRDIEDIKLRIIDAIESNRRPEPFEDVKWLYDLQWSDRDYAFLWREFSAWLSNNALSIEFKVDSKFGYSNEYAIYTMHINPSSYGHHDYTPELDVTSWYDKMMHRWNPSVFRAPIEPPQSRLGDGFFEIPIKFTSGTNNGKTNGQ